MPEPPGPDDSLDVNVAADKLITLLDRLDKTLGPATKYALGKRYKRQGRFADALIAFQKAEVWLAEKHGPDHPYVVSAIVNQAWCHASMKDFDEACRNYERALMKMEEIGYGEHELARRIREYLATVCG